MIEFLLARPLDRDLIHLFLNLDGKLSMMSDRVTRDEDAWISSTETNINATHNNRVMMEIILDRAQRID